MRLNVGSGSYAFRCLFEDSEALTGPTVVVGGHARGTPAILPVTRNDLLAPARQYHDWVAAGLSTLAGQAGGLAADVRTSIRSSSTRRPARSPGTRPGRACASGRDRTDGRGRSVSAAVPSPGRDLRGPVGSMNS